MNTEKFIHVIDSSCTEEYPRREHEIDGLTVVFEYGKKTILPYAQGLKFNLPGFTLQEVDGSAIALPAQAKEGLFCLAKDEVVAKLAELTTTSLKLRAAQKKGGEMFLDAGEDGRADMISFIIGEAPVVAAAAETPAAEAETDDLIDTSEEGDVLPEITDPAALPSGSEPNTNPETIAPAADVGNDAPLTETNVETDAVHTDDEVESGAGTGEETPAAEEPKFSLNDVKGATDEALQLCVDYGIELSALEGKGTGEAGNILKSDVEAYISENNLLPVIHTVAE